MTKKAFCANEQKVTEHKVDYVNNEFIFTCKCERFFKLPGELKKEEISKALKAHEQVNKHQVTQESVEKEKEEKLKLIKDA